MVCRPDAKTIQSYTSQFGDDYFVFWYARTHARALRRAIAVMRKGDTTPIISLVRCSKSNGRMENAVKIYCGQLKTVKHFFESKVKR